MEQKSKKVKTELVAEDKSEKGVRIIDLLCGGNI